MKKYLLAVVLVFSMPVMYSCSNLGKLAYSLTEQDAADAIRQLLQFGSREGLNASAFSKQALIEKVVPGELQTPLRILQALGLTGELDKLTSTLETAATKTAERSIPIFEQSISSMQLTDAMHIVKKGGTSATDYLRLTAGDNIRTAIKPVMQDALNTYQVNKYWDKLKKPLQGVLGEKFNPDLAGMMSFVVTEAMFNKIAEKEKQVRADAAARQTPLLQKVFSKDSH